MRTETESLENMQSGHWQSYSRLGTFEQIFGSRRQQLVLIYVIQVEMKFKSERTLELLI